MKRTAIFVILALAFILPVSSGCAASKGDQQLAQIETQIQALNSAVSSIRQDISSIEQSLASTQQTTLSLQQQLQEVSKSITVANTAPAPIIRTVYTEPATYYTPYYRDYTPYYFPPMPPRPFPPPHP